MYGTRVADLGGHLDGADKASLFDALEQAATRVGLALFVVHVDAAPPTVIFASDLLGTIVGRPSKEMVGRPPWELVAPAQQARVRETIASRGRGAPPTTMATIVERPNGKRRDVEVGVARIMTDDGELAVCYFRDTTGEHAALEALGRSETQFRSLIENAPDGVVILQEGRIVLANPIAVQMFGGRDFEAVRGRLLADFLPPSEAARAMHRIAKLYAGAAIESSEYQLTNGLVVEVHSVVYEYYDKPAILAFVRDVTERRRMQEQLYRGDRLTALGTMAATVAHEINNPLTYMQLHLQALDREAATDPNPARAEMLRGHISDALHGVARVATIVSDLRAYSREQGEEPQTPVDVVAVVERALQMVEHDLRHRAQLVRRFPDEPAVIDGSAGRLEQIVINLLVNALQALDGTDPSKERITVEIDAGRYVTIIVTDTGPGIAEPARLFEPFFTTKASGNGTGLGLFVCKQLVEQMHGRIEIVSTSRKGTSLAVTLPRRDSPLPQPTIRSTDVLGDRFRILIIDDEPHVRHAIANLLACDHEVESVGDGESALAILAGSHFDVILCDVMMPHMNGRELYERIRASWPGLERRIVFVTGGAFVPSLAGFLDSVDNLTLRKPFTVEHVLELVREAQQRARLA